MGLGGDALKCIIILVIMGVITLIWPTFLGMDMTVFSFYIGGLMVLGLIRSLMGNEEASGRLAIMATVVIIYMFVIKVILPMFAYLIFAGIPTIGDLIVEFGGNTFVILAIGTAIASPIAVDSMRVKVIIWINAAILSFLVYTESNPTVAAFLAPLYWYVNPGMVMIFLTVMMIILMILDAITGGGE